MRIAGWALVAVAACTVAGACTNHGTPCYAGDYRACDCPTGVRGYERCSADGQAYGACDCSGNIPGVASSGSDAGAPDAIAETGADAGGLLPFMAPCAADAECSTGHCFTFPSKGKYCSKPCTQAGECPPPSTGCNNQGYCKAP